MFPKVSVIIPCYNAMAFVGQAIESALSQTYPHTEVLVVDDGSTDESARVIRSYGNRIISISQGNAGVSAARNVGIKASTGEFIAFLDADDYWLPRKLTMQIPMFDDMGIGLVHAYHYWVDISGIPFKELCYDTAGDVFHQLLQGCTIGISSVVIRRDLIDRIGPFDTALQGAADLDMWLRSALQCKVQIVKELLGCHRLVPDSMSADYEHMVRDLVRVLEKNRNAHRQCEQCRRSIEHGKKVLKYVYGHRILDSALRNARAHSGGVLNRICRAILLCPPLLSRKAAYSVLLRSILNQIGVSA